MQPSGQAEDQTTSTMETNVADNKEEGVTYPSFSSAFKQLSLDPDFTKYTALTETQLQEFADQNIETAEESMTGIKIKIEESLSKGTGIQKYTAYLIKGQDEKGVFEVTRRYSEFDTLRAVMLERWPGCFVPAIPAKQLLNKTELQTTLNRMRFLNEFLKKISELPNLYYGEQFQVFLRSSDVDVTKSLEKFKKDSTETLIKKYEEAFKDCIDGDKNLVVNMDKLAQFSQFIKQARPKVVEFRKQARNLAEARQTYDQKIGLVFDRVLPVYEEGSLPEFADGAPATFLFARVHEEQQLADYKNKLISASKQNPYWLIYDLLKFEERQLEALQDCFKGVDKVRDKVQDCTKDIDNNNEEITNLEQGKTTFRSLLTKGTNEQIITKLKADNEELEKQKKLLLELQGIIAQHLTRNIIHNFKLNRQRLYSRTLRKCFSYETHYVRVASHFFQELKELSVLKAQAASKAVPIIKEETKKEQSES